MAPTLLAPDTTVVLNNGLRMPQLGFGVSEARDAEASVSEALEQGYRSIDTAAVYGNEEGVGRAIAASGIPRDELFVTTKVWRGHEGCAHARDCAAGSLERLGLDFVDLHLVHWPADVLAESVQTWDGMEQLLAEGRTRAIGVSNFRAGHLRRLLDLGGTVPAVNQIELHPHLQQHELRALHAALGITTEAWSPLGRGAVLDEPTLRGRRRAARSHAGPGRAALAPPAGHGRDPQVRQPRAHRREPRPLRLRADRRGHAGDRRPARRRRRRAHRAGRPTSRPGPDHAAGRVRPMTDGKLRAATAAETRTTTAETANPRAIGTAPGPPSAATGHVDASTPTAPTPATPPT